MLKKYEALLYECIVLSLSLRKWHGIKHLFWFSYTLCPSGELITCSEHLALGHRRVPHPTGRSSRVRHALVRMCSFSFTSVYGLTHGLFRSVFIVQVLEIFLFYFCYWFLVGFHCSWRTHSVWLQFFKICWGLLDGAGYGLSWYMFNEYLKKMGILLL